MYRSTHAMFTLSGSVDSGVLAGRRHRPAVRNGGAAGSRVGGNRPGVGGLNQPGNVIGITDRNQTLKIGAYGYADMKAKKPVTPDTLFEIGSVTKSFTAISLMQLFDEGRFEPQAPVSKYLPWFQVKSKFRAPSPTTIT